MKSVTYPASGTAAMPPQPPSRAARAIAPFAKGGLKSLIVVVLALGGCSILPPQQTPDVYVLPESTSAQSNDATQPLAWQLRVDTPDADGLIGTDGIVVLPQPGRITVYKDARWSASAPTLLGPRLVDAFLATHRLPAVSGEDARLTADIVLGGNLRAFQSEYRDGRPVVVIRYDARLRLGTSRRVFAARSFEIAQPASGTSVAQVVQAFGAAGDQLSVQVVAWTLDQGQRAWQVQGKTTM